MQIPQVMREFITRGARAIQEREPDRGLERRSPGWPARAQVAVSRLPGPEEGSGQHPEGAPSPRSWVSPCPGLGLGSRCTYEQNHSDSHKCPGLRDLLRGHPCSDSSAGGLFQLYNSTSGTSK